MGKRNDVLEKKARGERSKKGGGETENGGRGDDRDSQKAMGCYLNRRPRVELLAEGLEVHCRRDANVEPWRKDDGGCAKAIL